MVTSFMAAATRAAKFKQQQRVVDTFTRSNSTTSAGAADTGQILKSISGSPWGILDNRLHWYGTGTGRIVYNFGYTNVSISATVHNPSASNQRLVMRAQSSTNHILIQFTVGGKIQAYAVINGVAGSPIATSTESVALADGDRMVCSVVDDNFIVSVNTTDYVSFTTSQFAGVNAYGVGVIKNTVEFSAITITPTNFNVSIPKTFDSQFGTYGIAKYAATHHSDICATIVDDPVLGSARKVLKAVVPDTAIGPTANPRWQASTNTILTADDEFYVGFSVMFPADLPAIPAGPSGFMETNQLWGQPYVGSSPFHHGFTSITGDHYVWRAGSTGFPVNAILWDMGTPPKNVWIDTVVHIKLSNDPTVGFVEFWINTGAGWVKQVITQFDGHNYSPDFTRIYLQTQVFDPVLGAVNGIGPNHHDIQVYRKVGMFDSVTMWFAEHKVDSTFAAVDPHSHDWRQQ